MEANEMSPLNSEQMLELSKTWAGRTFIEVCRRVGANPEMTAGLLLAVVREVEKAHDIEELPCE